MEDVTICLDHNSTDYEGLEELLVHNAATVALSSWSYCDVRGYFVWSAFGLSGY